MRYRASTVVLLILCVNFIWDIKAVNYSLAGLLALWTVLSVRGMASMRSQVFGRVYWRGDPAGKAVALSFDDGPSETFTAQVLDVLKEHDVRATFFVIGNNLARYPELAARTVREGHELANHSQSHPWVFRMKFSSIRDDIDLCQDEIEKAAGYRPRFFRQPVGLNNPSVMKVLDEMGMVMVGWQARAYDGFRVRPDKVVSRILKSVGPGGIILLHDGCDGVLECDRTPTVEALRVIIPALKEKGYEFKTVSGLLGIENIQRQN